MEDTNLIYLIISIGITTLTLGVIIGRYLKSRKVRTLQQKLIAQEFENDVLLFGFQDDNNKLSTELENLEVEYERYKKGWEDQMTINKHLENKVMGLMEKLRISAKVLIVPNINPHHKADVDYVGIYPNFTETGLEPAHITREAYQVGVDRLKNNPEDKVV